MSRGDDARAEAEERIRAELVAQQLVHEQFTSAVPSGVDQTVQKVVVLEDSRQPAARATDWTRRFEVSASTMSAMCISLLPTIPSVRAKLSI